MARRFETLSEQHIRFIAEQKLFFVGTAAEDSRVNISPKGMDTLRVLDNKRVVWLNVTGSGNETAAHLLENDRMTLMFCAFEGTPLILRLYGRARIFHPRDAAWNALAALFPPMAGARQIIDMAVGMVQTSCGMGVPLFDFKGERDQLMHWAEKKGDDGLKLYWEQKNQFSIDGKPTRILEP